MTLTGPSLPATSGTAKQLVVILHGWGADGANLIDIAELFAADLPDAHFIAPNAPEPCEANPYGFQWFSLMDRNPLHLFAGAERAAKVLNGFLDEQLAELGLTNDKLALVGFSQGTMLALHVALRRQPQIAGLVGFSGALIEGEASMKEIKSRPPVTLIHGEQDDVVPFASLARAQGALKAAGINVETYPRPMLGHSIDMPGIGIAKAALKKVFT